MRNLGLIFSVIMYFQNFRLKRSTLTFQLLDALPKSFIPHWEYWCCNRPSILVITKSCLNWHYALNIVDQDDDFTYMCEKTLYNIRRILLDNDLWGTVFSAVTDSFIKLFKVDTDKQRLDSTQYPVQYEIFRTNRDFYQLPA